MSIVMADIDTNHMLPSGQPYTLDQFPFGFAMWIENPGTENGREFVSFHTSLGGNDYIQYVTNNTNADTPASYTGLRLESIAAQGSRNRPQYDTDVLPLSGWTHLMCLWEDANTHTLLINNSAGPSPTATNYPQTYFNAANEYLDNWYFFGRPFTTGPGNGATHAGLVMFNGRLPTTTEKAQLQLYWPSTIPTLTDCRVWDCEDDLLEANGGAALVNNNTDQYTLDGSAGANPSLVAYGADGGNIIIG